MPNYLNHYDYCAQFMAPPAKILDVGSGRGKFLCEMARRGYEAYGVEPSQDYIKMAYEKAEKENVHINLVCGRAESLPFLENEFDFVNCSEVSEHADSPQKLSEEIFRVLKPGGKCYVSFHNRFGIYDYHYHLYGINWLPRLWAEPILRFLGRTKDEGTDTGRQKLTSMHYFSYNQVVKIIKKNGFTFIDIREEKIKERFPAFAAALLLIYRYLARPILFNSFHLLLVKPIL